jgi:hypothetical protein
MIQALLTLSSSSATADVSAVIMVDHVHSLPMQCLTQSSTCESWSIVQRSACFCKLTESVYRLVYTVVWVSNHGTCIALDYQLTLCPRQSFSHIQNASKKTLTLRVIVALPLPLWVSSKLIGESGAWSYAKSDDWSHVVVYFHVC